MPTKRRVYPPLLNIPLPAFSVSHGYLPGFGFLCAAIPRAGLPTWAFARSRSYARASAGMQQCTSGISVRYAGPWPIRHLPGGECHTKSRADDKRGRRDLRYLGADATSARAIPLHRGATVRRKALPVAFQLPIWPIKVVLGVPGKRHFLQSDTESIIHKTLVTASA